MDVDGICLSILDTVIYKVEQMTNGIAEEEESIDLIQQIKPTYNLHPFNDLYPYYPLTKMKVPRMPQETDYSLKTTKVRENIAKLDRLLQNSEKLMEYSEMVLKKLEGLEKTLLSNQQNVFTSSGLNNLEVESAISIAKPPLSLIENIPIENRTRQVEIQFARVEMKREKLSEDEENKPIVPKRAKLRIGLSKRRSRQ